MAEPERILGRYVVVRELGRGGMAIVYLARQPDLGREVALKELLRFHALDPAMAERFAREAQVAGSLSHPNIATVYESFEHDGIPYIAVEYLERGSLRPLVRSLTTAQIVGVLEGLLAGLAHAHAHGVVHRDLKPENVLVTEAGAVKIADFGIAKAYNTVWTAEYPTATGMAIGTPAYMAPEQAMGRGIGPGTDLYAVGVIAYELLCGRPPFHDVEQPMAVMLHHVSEPVPPLRGLAPDTDERLVAWVERLLAKTPGERWEDAAAAWDALEDIAVAMLGPMWRREARLPGADAAARERPLTPAAFEATPPGPLPSPPPTPSAQPPAPPARTPATGPAAGPPPAPHRRRRGLAAAAGLAVLVLVAAAAFALGRSGDGGGGGAAADTAALPDCMKELLDGATTTDVVENVSDAEVVAYRDAPGKRLGLVLRTTKPIGAMTFTYTAEPEHYTFEKLIGPDCKPIEHTFSRGGSGPNFETYEQIRFRSGDQALGVGMGASSDDPMMHANLIALKSPDIKVTSATVEGRRAVVTGTIAPDVTDEVTIDFSAQVPGGDPVAGRVSKKPDGGRFEASVKGPEGATDGKVTVTYPGDDTYAPESVSADIASG